MKKKPTYFNEIIEILQDIHKSYPSYPIARIITTAIDEYPDTWGMSDKEFLFALRKYRAQLQMDIPHETDEIELQRIIKDGISLNIDSEEDFINGQDY